MARKDPRDVRRVTNIGAGPIGGGWSAHFLARGYRVTTYLHDATEEGPLRELVETAWVSLEALGLAEGASLENLACTTDLAEACAEADFVQESVPENLALKQALYETLGALVPAEVVIASSTSGLSMTDIQARCSTPERTVVAHPFNPPYLLPLVEMIGGERTAPETVAWAVDFYRLVGKAPLVMERELPGFIATRLQEALWREALHMVLPGFIATRLQEALWREALHMVANGEATVEQIDLAVATGPGPRWAVMGPCMAFHVASGEGGMAHNLDHFGPALKLPWTRLEAPELTPEPGSKRPS
jgi:carnitine 3-dehydrogenase